MKSLLTIALAAAGLCAALPSEAQADGYRSRYNDCDSRYGGRTYRSYRSYDNCAPRYYDSYSYRRPVRVYRYSDYECAPRVRYYSAPRFSFSFGF